MFTIKKMFTLKTVAPASRRTPATERSSGSARASRMLRFGASQPVSRGPGYDMRARQRAARSPGQVSAGRAGGRNPLPDMTSIRPHVLQTELRRLPAWLADVPSLTLQRWKCSQSIIPESGPNAARLNNRLRSSAGYTLA